MLQTTSCLKSTDCLATLHKPQKTVRHSASKIVEGGLGPGMSVWLGLVVIRQAPLHCNLRTECAAQSPHMCGSSRSRHKHQHGDLVHSGHNCFHETRLRSRTRSVMVLASWHYCSGMVSNWCITARAGQLLAWHDPVVNEWGLTTEECFRTCGYAGWVCKRHGPRH